MSLYFYLKVLVRAATLTASETSYLSGGAIVSSIVCWHWQGALPERYFKNCASSLRMVQQSYPGYQSLIKILKNKKKRFF